MILADLSARRGNVSNRKQKANKVLTSLPYDDIIIIEREIETFRKGYKNMKYSNISTLAEFKAFLKDVDAAEYWNDFEPEEWESACSFAGIDMSRYEDPEELFDALESFVY